MGELANRQELFARLRQPLTYPARESDLREFLLLDQALYQDRVSQLPDAELRQEYLSVQDRLSLAPDDVTLEMLANRGQLAMHEVRARATTLPDLTDWHGILNHRPAAAGLQTLPSAAGDLINFDYYAVEITRLPLGPDGRPMSRAEVLEAVRADFNGMLRRGNAVGYFSEGFEQPIPSAWGPTEAPHIHINLSFWDDGTVAITQNTVEEFRATTVFSLGDREHPVSGSRAFGHEDGPSDTARIYTRGADRPTGWIDDMFDGTIFEGADEMWRGWQRGVAAWIKLHGGAAHIVQPVIHHVSWSEVDTFLYRHDNHLWAQAAHAGLEHGAPPLAIDPPYPVIDLDNPADADLELATDVSLEQAPMSWGPSTYAPPLDPSVVPEVDQTEYPLDPSQPNVPADWTPVDPANEVSEYP